MLFEPFHRLLQFLDHPVTLHLLQDVSKRIGWPRPFPEGKTGLDGHGDKDLRLSDRFKNALALGQKRCNCRSERTPCPMGIPCLDPLAFDLMETSPIIKDVDRHPPQVAPFHNDMLRSQLVNPVSGFPHLLNRIHLKPGENGGLRKVRSHHHRKGKQPSYQGIPSIFPKKGISALGNHHGINHNLSYAILSNLFGYSLNNLRIGQHSRLDRIGTDIGENRINLGFNKSRWDFMDGLNSDRILSGQGRENTHPVATQQGDRF